MREDDRRRRARLPAVALAGSAALLAACGGTRIGRRRRGQAPAGRRRRRDAGGREHAGGPAAARAHRLPTLVGPGAEARGEVFTIAPDGTDERQLTVTTRSTGATTTRTSPRDGSLIAFQRCDEGEQGMPDLHRAPRRHRAAPSRRLPARRRCAGAARACRTPRSPRLTAASHHPGVGPQRTGRRLHASGDLHDARATERGFAV